MTLSERITEKEEFNNEYFESLLMQFRLFYEGCAMKGTFLVNKKVSFLSYLSSNMSSNPISEHLFRR
ncbi:hypothetical protein DVH24_037432 [Malus domestica]|uniref:Uncharacterized protein n=1 Tax=Malus domestica TaxID=3750 RepID=A0A498HDW7_MALDO|nr:hypothetical protein DVH24_037432 [Malus domestica]